MNPIELLRTRTRDKLLHDFATFARRAWKEIEPKQLQWNWHHSLIAEHLELAYQKEIRRLIITVPPRNLKSRIVSVLFPAWCWARDPSLSFVLTSYSDSLSEELSVLRRNLMQSRWFQESFPDRVQFAPDQNRREQYANLRGGMMIASSTEGTVTGKGGDFLICDDLLSPQQSYSDLARENANRFFDSTMRSRLNEPERGVVIIIAQRLHERDLPGHLEEREPGEWVRLNLPMECEQDEQIFFPVSRKTMERKAGDLLHPARFPKSWCEKTKATVGTYIWSAQYEQRPGALGGAVFKSKWFEQYDVPPERGRVIVSIDTAFSIRKGADFSVASVWRAHEGRYFLLFTWRERCEYPQLKKTVEGLYESWHPDTVLIEERGSGQSLLQSLKQETSLPVVGFKVDTDKVSRAHSVTALFETGRVLFPKSASWLSTFLHELEMFPSGAHDDQVDALTMALTYLRGQEYEGSLTLVNVFKKLEKLGGWFDRSRPIRDPQSMKPKGPIETRDENRLGPQSPCPLCGGPRIRMSGGLPGYIKLHCNQCSSDDGAFPPAPITPGVDCCGDPLPQTTGGIVRCGNCGKQASANIAVNGITRAQYSAGVGRGRGMGGWN